MPGFWQQNYRAGQRVQCLSGGVWLPGTVAAGWVARHGYPVLVDLNDGGQLAVSNSNEIR